MRDGENVDPALERWLRHALSTRRRDNRAGASPYAFVSPGASETAAKRRRRASLDQTSPCRWKEDLKAGRPVSPGPETASAPQYGSLPKVPAGAPPGKRRRDSESRQSERRPLATSNAYVLSARCREEGEWMSAADLASKKMLLPFIDKLSFIEIALAERGNPSGTYLAPSNPSAKDSMALFQSTYVFKEGMNNLAKATAAGGGPQSLKRRARTAGISVEASGKHAIATTSDAASRAATGRDGTAVSGAQAGSVAGSALGKRGRGEGGQDKPQDDRNGGHLVSRHPRPETIVHHGGAHLGSSAAQTASGSSVKHGSDDSSAREQEWPRSSQGIRDASAVLNRYPQFCDSMGMTLGSLNGVAARHHPPTWTLTLCEEVLDECWKAEKETGAGGARLDRNARRAAAGTAARSAAATAEIDKWCLAQAKDLELREEGERHDNREQRRKRRQRQRRQDRRQGVPTAEGSAPEGGTTPAEASGLRLPLLMATFLTGRFGKSMVALQVALDLLLGLEALRPSFPELEHFSLLLRELHDEAALAVVLHTRGLVSHICGLRLKDLKHRVAKSAGRPPLRNELVLLPHPALATAAKQPWLTRKGSLTVAFLLLGGTGCGTPGSKKMAGVLQDARHLVSMARAAWGVPADAGEDMPTLIAEPNSDRDATASDGGNLGRTASGPESDTADPVTGYLAREGHDEQEKRSVPSVSAHEKKRAETEEVSRNPGHSDKKTASASSSRYIPLHGLLFLLGELHMKTPEDIHEKANSSNKGGGLGALKTLALAVEQEAMREELCAKLVEEARILAVLGAEVTRLEGRTRALKEGESAKGLEGGSAVDGLTQARVALALKVAAKSRQSDIVSTMRSEVQQADTQVAASWQDVMSPPPLPAAPNVSNIRAGSSGQRRTTCGANDSAVEAVTPGNGFTQDSAADLNFVLNKSGDSLAGSGVVSVENIQHGPSGYGRSWEQRCAERSGRFSGSGGEISTSQHSSSAMASCGRPQEAVAGSTPLEVKPGVAAGKVLLTLRMYVKKLRVTKDNETRAEDIDWMKKAAERREAATIVVQRLVRRVRRDRAAIKLATVQANRLRYARDKAKRHALAEEERQVLATREVLKKQQNDRLREQEAIDTILKDAMHREADQRFWRSRVKIQRPILCAWRLQARAETRFRSAWRQRLRRCMSDWRQWIVRHRAALKGIDKIRCAWLSSRDRWAGKQGVVKMKLRQQRIKAFVVKALERQTEKWFVRWKHFSYVSKKVKRMGALQCQQGLQQRLKRWKIFVDLRKAEKTHAATQVQALARSSEAKRLVEQLRNECRARVLVRSQICVHVAVVRFRKFRQRMARLIIEADAFRKKRDAIFYSVVLATWREHCRGRGLARRKITAMARRRNSRMLLQVSLAWRTMTLEIVRARQDEEDAERRAASTRMSASTLLQAVWRSHEGRKGFDGRRRQWRSAVLVQKRWRGFRVRSTMHTMADQQHGATALQRIFRGHQARSGYYIFFLGEAFRAASTGSYERLFLLSDRCPDLMHLASEGWEGMGMYREGERVLHVACRAAADRCVRLCLQRQADVRAASSAGLTPLHCLALYSLRGRGRCQGDEGPDDLQSQSLTTANVEPAKTAAMAVPDGTTTPESPTEPVDHAAGTQARQELSVDRSVRTIAKLLMQEGAETHATDHDGNTPLLTAARTGAAALCELLLSHGANADERNYSGASALFVAVTGENPACVEVLLHAGSNPTESNQVGATALHVAAEKGMSKVMSHLLCHGAAVDALDSWGLTPLMCAVAGDHGDAAGLLCDYGADLDLVDVSGRTALHVATQEGRVNALREILGRSVDIDARDENGEAALHRAARSGQVQVARALLESGADPNLQDYQGDNAAHIAARKGHLEVVEALVMYDVHIGQRNWKELTPFGEARMNNHPQVARFLSESFVSLSQPLEKNTSADSSICGKVQFEDTSDRGHHQVGWWDQEMEDKAVGWEQAWDADSQSFYYFNRETQETSFTAPFKASADRVEELRRDAEVRYRRKIKAVKGNALVGLSDYREAFMEERLELTNQKLRQKAATTIQAGWRARGARKEAGRLRREKRSSMVIQRTVRRFLGRRRRETLERRVSACLGLQALFRGYRARKEHQMRLCSLERSGAERTLNRLLTRVFRGHYHGRKRARKLRAQRAGAWWGSTKWEAALHEAGGPEYALRTFTGETGKWEAYRLMGSIDVNFYRNATTEEYTWDLPEEWRVQDEYDFYEGEHVRLYGFSAAEAQAATLLQNAWRGKTARKHFQLLLRAQRICKGAEAAYLANPESLRCQINYILFTHVIEKRYDRARILYAKALRSMEEKGPDMQLLLYAYAVFCHVTGEEDTDSVIALVERAILAQTDATPGHRPWSAETHTTRRNPKRFALAEAGFFRFAAYNINDAESWHNYAACRQLVYGDFDGASECYLKAIQIDPKNAHIQGNYQGLLDSFPEQSLGSSTFESLSTHHLQQAEADKRRQETGSAKFLQRPEAKKAALMLERAFLRSKQRQIDTLGSYLGPTAALLREAQAEALALEREQSPSAVGNSRSNHETVLGSRDSLTGDGSTSSIRRSSRKSSRHGGQLRLGYDNAADSLFTSEHTRTNALPLGWDSATDDAGNVFFYNAYTGESTWDPPPTPDENFPSGDAVNAHFDAPTDQRFDTAPDSSSTSERVRASALPLGWDSATDDTGNVFYYNTDTGESTWDPPPTRGEKYPGGDAVNATFDPPTDQRSQDKREEKVEIDVGYEEAWRMQDSPQIPAALPLGWEAVVAEDGAVYYHHVASGATQWDLPHPEQGDIPQAVTVGEDAWEEFATDEQVPYWHNAATGESSWLPPE